MSQWKYYCIISATNRRYREYRTSPKLCRRPHVPSPTGSSVSSDEFKYSTSRERVKFIGENGQIKVYAGNKLIFKANLEQGLYYAYPDIEPKYASSIEKAIKIEGKPNDLMTWHERFGQANVDYILKTSRLDASIECTRSKAPLNLLHCDVWGPANVIGIKPSIRHLRPFGSILYVRTPRPLRGKLDPKAKKGILVGFAPGTRYRVWIPEDSRVIETSNVRFQKPQQSNSGVALVSPGFKFSDYEVVENCEDDKTVNSIPVSLPQNSYSETEDEEPSRTDQEESSRTNSSVVPVKTTWKRVVVPQPDGSINDIYYYELGKSQSLRSCNEIKKYCMDKNLEFEGIINPQPSVSGVQSVKVKK
ncbi:retrovirus-related Pol polyprotein from transposon TNT 1-94 [Trichonephila clavipes]|nr:retrovirus-related Pol polyprotein from transposon TNT 1-94 [Trichonephila clavipes]